MKQSVLIISALHYLCTQKKIRMGLFKKIKDIFSNDKDKETNTQENVSLPSSINVPQQSTKQPLVMPGVTEVIKARTYLKANDPEQTKCQYESAVQKGYSLNLEPYNWLLSHYTSKEQWSDAKRVLLLVPAKFSQDALVVEFREVISATRRQTTQTSQSPQNHYYQRYIGKPIQKFNCSTARI